MFAPGRTFGISLVPRLNSPVAFCWFKPSDAYIASSETRASAVRRPPRAINARPTVGIGVLSMVSSAKPVHHARAQGPSLSADRHRGPIPGVTGWVALLGPSAGRVNQPPVDTRLPRCPLAIRRNYDGVTSCQEHRSVGCGVPRLWVSRFRSGSWVAQQEAGELTPSVPPGVGSRSAVSAHPPPVTNSK